MASTGARRLSSSKELAGSMRFEQLLEDARHRRQLDLAFLPDGRALAIPARRRERRRL